MQKVWKFRFAAAVAVFAVMLAAGHSSAAESQKLFDKDVNKQKAGLEKDFVQAEEFLGQTKLQNVRSQVELLEHKLNLLKSDLTKEEAASYQARIDKVVTRIGAKEDSLIKVTMDILNTKGVDPALAYLQNDLRMFGVSEKKTGPAEKTILEEAPRIQQALEHKAIDRAVKALQSGKPLDPDMDPYIVKTAERIIKAHADSVTAVENAKARKDLEEKQQVERIQREKEEKEKKIEEEKAAKIKQEEDKKKLAEQEIARKKAEADEKEKQRLAKIEQERQQKLAVAAEKAKKDSIAAAQKLAQQQAQQEKERQSKLSAQQKEQDRLAKIEAERQQKLAVQAEKARKDSLAAAQKLAEKQAKQERGKSWKDSLAAARQDSIAQQQALLAEVKKMAKEQQAQQEKGGQGKLAEQQKEQEQLARAEEERRAQELAQQDKVRAQKDSIAAAQKAQQQQAPSAAAKKAEKEAQQQEIQAKDQQRKLEAEQKEQERLARAEEERRRQELALQDKVRAQKDSIAAAQKRSAMQVQQEKEQQKKLEAQQKEQERLARAEEERKKQEREMRERYEADSIADAQTKLAISKSAQKYLQGLRDNQKKAQDMVMALYDLIDKKRVREALDGFKQDRAFIAQFVDAQVFNVLEQTIAQSAASAQPEAAAAAPAKPEARVPEQESIDKINSFMRDNNVVGAYGEFKKTESALRHYMTREEFKQLKNMVENAYKIRKQGAK